MKFWEKRRKTQTPKNDPNDVTELPTMHLPVYVNIQLPDKIVEYKGIWSREITNFVLLSEAFFYLGIIIDIPHRALSFAKHSAYVWRGNNITGELVNMYGVRLGYIRDKIFYYDRMALDTALESVSRLYYGIQNPESAQIKKLLYQSCTYFCAFRCFKYIRENEELPLSLLSSYAHVFAALGITATARGIIVTTKSLHIHVEDYAVQSKLLCMYIMRIDPEYRDILYINRSVIMQLKTMLQNRSQQ